MFQAFSAGTTLWYLGKPYVLTIRSGASGSLRLHALDRVTLEGGRFVVETGHPFPNTIERLVRTWYSQQTMTVFKERLDLCFDFFLTRFASELQAKFLSVSEVSCGDLATLKPHLVVRFFKARWGHMTRGRVIVLNCELIHVSVEWIDAVIFHELVHMLHFNHQRPFHDCLEALLPRHRQVSKALGEFWAARLKEREHSTNL